VTTTLSLVAVIWHVMTNRPARVPPPRLRRLEWGRMSPGRRGERRWDACPPDANGGGVNSKCFYHVLCNHYTVFGGCFRSRSATAQLNSRAFIVGATTCLAPCTLPQHLPSLAAIHPLVAIAAGACCGKRLLFLKRFGGKHARLLPRTPSRRQKTSRVSRPFSPVGSLLLGTVVKYL
jgi:hypothetical protein